MKTNLSLGIDLGSDTLKIAFAYKSGKTVHYGKFDSKPILTQIALPSVAYYDRNENKWLFCDQVGKGERTSFITVVKIKSLISLLSIVDNPKYSDSQCKKITKKNIEYYKQGNQFPKFYFPAKKKMLEDFDEMVNAGQTFTVANCTPHSVCLDFFLYVKNIINKRIVELQEQAGVEIGSYQIALVHPSSVGEAYIRELSDIVNQVFSQRPHKILSSNKALAFYGEHIGSVQNGDDFLVFDMAEEDISVARISIKNDAIIIDGKDGHNDPIEIGGHDVDEAIVRRLEGMIFDREIIGTPSSGKKGHIIESGIYSKQYLLMKDIKRAKVIFSKPLKVDSIFNDGVPVTFSYDLLIQKKLTKEDIRKSIGVDGDSGIAYKIYEYIESEIRKPLNYAVKKIFISGGLTETYSLLEYLRSKLKKDHPRVQLCTFDAIEKDTPTSFLIQSFEDSVFAPAVGGAIASLTNKTIKVVLSLSYGTWFKQDGKKCLQIFANRGDEIGNGKAFAKEFTLSGVGASSEEILSTFVTESDIKRGIDGCLYVKGYIAIGDYKSTERTKLSQLIGLKTVSGGSNGYTRPMYRGANITICGERDYYGNLLNDKITFIEGMKVDKDGRATPIVENVSSASDCVKINYGGRMMRVRASDIDIDTNLTEFTTSRG